ncbi:MAG: hypothetical protein OXS40_13105 [Gammaproteobacteria bacterium]|nr:hypothetical protein [Gammaproteobacteria bacterium]
MDASHVSPVAARYPLNRPGDPDYRALVGRCREVLRDTGALALPGFLPPALVREVRSHARAAMPGGYRMSGRYNPYSEDLSAGDDLSLPPDHPARLRLPASHLSLAGDLLPADSVLYRLHRDPSVCRFLADALESPALYPVTDPLGGVNVLVYKPGNANGWHFDSVSFVVSLMLQNASEGGCYEYIPWMRSDADENLAEVARRMRSPDLPDGVHRITLDPGTLFLFKGRHTLHRVTRVAGDRNRIIAILSYHRTPGWQVSEGTRLALYGRVA